MEFKRVDYCCPFENFKGSNDVRENSIKYRTDEMTIKKEVKGEKVAVSLKHETHWSVPPKIPIQDLTQ